LAFTVEEAVSSLTSSGPAVLEQVEALHSEVVQLQTDVRQYEDALRDLQANLGEQQDRLDQQTDQLVESLRQWESQLDRELSDTEAAVHQLRGFLRLSQDELEAQFQRASQDLEGLKLQWDQLPPLLRKAIENQNEALLKTQKALEVANQSLSQTATKAIAEYTGLKTNVTQNQKVLQGQVEQVLHHMQQVQARTQVHTENLDKDSAKVVGTFDGNLKITLQEVVHKPGQQVSDGVQNLTNYAQKELERLFGFLVDQGLQKVLGGLIKISERNASIVRDLQRIIPGELSEGLRSLAYVVQNLDVIIKHLTRRAVNAVVDVINRGLDWLSKKTGINLDFLQKSISTVGKLVVGMADFTANQIRIAKTLITNPANLWSDIQTLVSDARSAASAVGSLVMA